MAQALSTERWPLTASAVGASDRTGLLGQIAVLGRARAATGQPSTDVGGPRGHELSVVGPAQVAGADA
jgi:hypothetical protein